jgi:hypothetical protein
MCSRRDLFLRAHRMRATNTQLRTGPLTGVIWLLLAITISLWLQPSLAHAQTTSNYVSGKGNDANPCTPSTPCLTLQRALSNTVAGGEVITLDSANYGYATINRAVTITNATGITGVLAMSSVTGITVAAGANDTINLQGLEIEGAGSGANGIQFSSGSTLNIKDSVIRGFNNGINFQPSGPGTLSVVGTLISGNSTGILFQTSATSSAALNDVQLINNATGLVASSASSTAVANINVQNSIVSSNSTVGILSGSNSAILVTNSVISNNGVGLQAQTASSNLQVSQSTVGGNVIEWTAANGGLVISAGKNSFGGNPVPPGDMPQLPPVVATFYLVDGSGGFLLDSNGAKIEAL